MPAPAPASVVAHVWRGAAASIRLHQHTPARLTQGFSAGLAHGSCWLARSTGPATRGLVPALWPAGRAGSAALCRSVARTPARQARSCPVRRVRRWSRWRQSVRARATPRHGTGTRPHCQPFKRGGTPYAAVLQSLPGYRQRRSLGPVVAALAGGAASPSRSATQPPPRQPEAVHGQNARPPCQASSRCQGLAVPGRGQRRPCGCSATAFSRAQAVGVGGTPPSEFVQDAPGVPAAFCGALGCVFGVGHRPGPSFQLTPPCLRVSVRRSSRREADHGSAGVCPQRSTAADHGDSTGSRPTGKSRDCS